jgi:hypothetical protein
MAQPVETDEQDADRSFQRLLQEVRRSARDDSDQAETRGQTGQELGNARKRESAHRVRHDGRQGAVKVEEERALSRVSGQRQKEVGNGAGGHRPRWLAQAPATRSAPMTTTTSSPVMALTGTDELKGRTAAGLRPSVVAIEVAAG